MCRDVGLALIDTRADTNSGFWNTIIYRYRYSVRVSAFKGQTVPTGLSTTPITPSTTLCLAASLATVFPPR